MTRVFVQFDNFDQFRQAWRIHSYMFHGFTIMKQDKWLDVALLPKEEYTGEEVLANIYDTYEDISQWLDFLLGA